MYLGNPTGDLVRAAMTAGHLGAIDTPEQRNVIPDGVPWCADNGVFGKGYPGDGPWLEWVASRPWDQRLCLFVVAPDVVGDAAGTLARSVPFLPAIRSLGYPAAFVAQNGAEQLDVPWDELDALFLGGGLECPQHGQEMEPRTVHRRPPGARGGLLPRHFCGTCGSELVEWKLGAGAAGLAGEARARGKWVHMGRVNTRGRLRHAHAIGCHSVDGTLLTRGARKNLPYLLTWLAQL